MPWGWWIQHKNLMWFGSNGSTMFNHQNTWDVYKHQTHGIWMDLIYAFRFSPDKPDGSCNQLPRTPEAHGLPSRLQGWNAVGRKRCLKMRKSMANQMWQPKMHVLSGSSMGQSLAGWDGSRSLKARMIPSCSSHNYNSPFPGAAAAEDWCRDEGCRDWCVVKFSWVSRCFKMLRCSASITLPTMNWSFFNV